VLVRSLTPAPQQLKAPAAQELCVHVELPYEKQAIRAAGWRVYTYKVGLQAFFVEFRWQLVARWGLVIP
jgi:hypothetical protein